MKFAPAIRRTAPPAITSRPASAQRAVATSISTSCGGTAKLGVEVVFVRLFGARFSATVIAEATEITEIAYRQLGNTSLRRNNRLSPSLTFSS
jgi:hypothetical protein